MSKPLSGDTTVHTDHVLQLLGAVLVAYVEAGGDWPGGSRTVILMQARHRDGTVCE
jgi:hypothetical protein